MLDHRPRNSLGRGQHAGDIDRQDTVARLGGVGERRSFVLDPCCGDEAVDAGVLGCDAGDESVQRGNVEHVDGVVG